MAFTLQDPASGLFWSVGPDQRIVLSQGSPSTYENNNGVISNTATGRFVQSEGSVGASVNEKEYSGPGYEFSWAVNSDGTISHWSVPVFIGPGADGLTVASEPYVWSVVIPAPPSRAEALLAEAESA